MKFLELRLRGFGKFSDKNIELKDGINLIYGDNEAGKSTLHNFIQGMLFGIEKQRGRASKEDSYLKYQPWDHQATYGGSIDLVYKEKNYRILRSFYKENREYKVIDLVTGREIPVSNIKGVSFIEGLTEENYRNTISIEQLKVRTDKELADEVRNHIANLSLSKSNQVDVGEATRLLSAKKKQIEANQTEKKLLELEDEIRGNSLEEVKMGELSSRIQVLEGKLIQEAKDLPGKDIDRLERYLAEYPGIREKYKQYLRLSEQKVKFENALKEEQKKDQERSHINETYSNIKGDNEIYENEKNKKGTGLSKKTFIHRASKIICIIVTIAVILGTFLGKGIGNDNFLIMGIGISFVWGVYYIMNGLLNSSKVAPPTHLNTKDENIVNPSSMNTEEKERIKKSIKDIIDRMQEEEQIILKYGNRILQISELLETSMEDLEKEIISLGENLKHTKEESRKKNEETRIELERLKWELEALEEHESFFYEKKSAYQELKEKLGEEEKERKAINLAIDTINRISTNIHDDFGQNLNVIMSDTIKEQTLGKYSNIKVDEKLNVKIAHKDRFIELDKLSVGTIEQIYLALRLSVTRFLFPEEKMPLLFDDTFVYYDEERLCATLEILAREKDRQILIFTCHKREEVLLQKLNIPYNKVMITNEISGSRH